jgi:hypothetical protein
MRVSGFGCEGIGMRDYDPGFVRWPRAPEEGVWELKNLV